MNDHLYTKLPTLVQGLLVNLMGFKLDARRYGKSYRATEKLVFPRGDLHGAKLRELKLARLRATFRAASMSEFWQERFKTYDVNPLSEDVEKEITKLPVLTKAEVQGNLAKIINYTSRDQGWVMNKTSGTTGTGLIFPETGDSERERWAVWWRYRARHGIDRKTWCGYFGGRTIVPLGQKTAPFWRVNYPGRQVLFSSHHLSPHTALAYVDEIKRRKISWLHGYPSSLAILAESILAIGINRIQSDVKIITTGAESLLPLQKSLIERAFGAKVIQHYGQAESVANISEWPDGQLRVDEDFSYVEFLPVQGFDNLHKIIGTSFCNPALPLIRYDTGDLAKLPEISPNPPDAGGRLISSIDGRIEDQISLPDGRKIGRLDHIFKQETEVRESQIVQKRDCIVLRLVVAESFEKISGEARIRGNAERFLGQMPILIEYLERIPRSPNGKLRFVIKEF